MASSSANSASDVGAATTIRAAPFELCSHAVKLRNTGGEAVHWLQLWARVNGKARASAVCVLHLAMAPKNTDAEEDSGKTDSSADSGTTSRVAEAVARMPLEST